MSLVREPFIIFELDSCIVQISVSPGKTHLELLGTVSEPSNKDPLHEETEYPNPLATLYRKFRILVERGVLKGPHGESNDLLKHRFKYSADMDLCTLLRQMESLHIMIRMKETTSPDDETYTSDRSIFMQARQWMDDTVVEVEQKSPPKDMVAIIAMTAIIFFVLGFFIWAAFLLNDYLGYLTAVLSLYWVFRVSRYNYNLKKFSKKSEVKAS